MPKRPPSLAGQDLLAAAGRELSLSELSYKLMLSIREAALLSGLAQGFLREAVRDGRLKGSVIGRGCKVKRADLNDFLRRLSAGRAPAADTSGAAPQADGAGHGTGLPAAAHTPEAPPPAADDGHTTFRLPGHAGARTVALAGSFNDWDPMRLILAREGGEWVGRLDLPPGRHAYKFVVDGVWIIDPGNPHAEGDGQGNVNSVLTKAH